MKRPEMKRLARFAALQALALMVALLVATLLVLVACGPVTKRIPTHFVVILENPSSGVESVKVRWAIGGIYVGAAERRVPPLGQAVVVLGESGPDLLEVEGVALKSAWGPPDWDGHFVFHVDVIRGSVWAEY